MKHCLECKKSLKGRSDKKFCDDGCRNTYNNRLNNSINQYVKNVNRLLKKNRSLLQNIIPENGKMTVTENTLKVMGYNFEYFTNKYVNKKGDVYTFCYEYGYLKINEGVFMLVKRHSNPLNGANSPISSNHSQ